MLFYLSLETKKTKQMETEGHPIEEQNKKKIEDYLHLYLGCEVEFVQQVWQLKSVEIGVNGNVIGKIRRKLSTRQTWDIEYFEFRKGGIPVKPILRSLSSMTEEEKIMLCCLNLPIGWQPGHIIKTNDEDIAAMRIFDMKGDYKSLYIPKSRITPNNFIYLLSKHFDLFGLIDSGLAIDATTIKKVNQ